MEQIRHIFIINPAAGKSDRSQTLVEEITQKAGSAGVPFKVHVTEYPRHACLIVQQAAQKYTGERLRFYACGGDGTLNEVATTAVGVKNCSFTHFPAGSGNDFIKIFGDGSVSRFQNLAELLHGDELELDFIESDCGIALNVMSTGIDARIAWGMQKYKRIPGFSGHGAYTASTVENIVRGLHDAYRVDIDGETLDSRYTLIMAANGRCYGGGYYAVPDADPRDGLMDILLVRDLSRLTATKAISAYKAGRYRELPHLITHRRAREMTVFTGGPRPLTINLDGEVEKTGRITVRVAKSKMRFIVPRGVEVCPPGER